MKEESGLFECYSVLILQSNQIQVAKTCNVKKTFLKKSSNLSSASRTPRWKTDTDDDVPAVDISVTFRTNGDLRHINVQQIGSSNIDSGLTKVPL